MSLGTKIKELREQKGWSQNALAEQAGLKRSYISLLEIDAIKSPGAEPVIKLAHAFEIDEDVLFEAAGLKVGVRPSSEFDDFVLYLQGKNPGPETLQQLRKIAEALLPGRPVPQEGVAAKETTKKKKNNNKMKGE